MATLADAMPEFEPAYLAKRNRNIPRPKPGAQLLPVALRRWAVNNWRVILAGTDTGSTTRAGIRVVRSVARATKMLDCKFV